MLRHRSHAHPDPFEDDPDRGYRLVQDAITAAATHRDLPSLSDEQIVDLAQALSDPHVRDRCLAAALPTPPDTGTETGSEAGARDADAAERLWTMLTRAVPPPARAEPAVLLAVHTHLRGRSVLASIALEIAQQADPDHPLARPLYLAIQRGMPPARLHQFLHSALVAAADATETTD